ncbi:hypothetical protein DL93DRAFT_750693 [Clavulina sp. PMI_390]|nr:hypothetical protein DL93DRAFT_750693 [Clavulina sp. PMI_390]
MATLSDVRKLQSLLALLDRPRSSGDEQLWRPSFEHPGHAPYFGPLASFDDVEIFSRVQAASKLIIERSRAPDNVAARQEHNRRAPIFWLPAEILSEIFFLSLPISPRSVWKAPILATCGRWRASAINTPRIWSYITITGDRNEGERLACWLERSGHGLPLTLDVFDTVAFKALESSWLTGKPSPAHRVRTLILRPTPYQIMWRKCPLPIEFNATNLREFHIIDRDMGVQTSQPLRLFANEYPTHLNNLTLFTGYGRIEPIGLDPSLLTDLRLTGELTTDHVVEVLAHTPRLESLHWGIVDKTTTDPPFPALYGTQRLVLSSLRRLLLEDETWSGVAHHVLPILQAPNLQEISLAQMDHIEHSKVFLETASRSPSLKRVQRRELDGGQCYSSDATNDTKSLLANEVTSLFHILPSLEYLDPYWCDANMQGLLALCGEVASYAGHGPSKWPCPSLRQLSLPINKNLENEDLSEEVASECLKRLLKIRGLTTPIGSESETGGLVVVLDVSIEQLQQLVGEEWIACGAAKVESSLAF